MVDTARPRRSDEDSIKGRKRGESLAIPALSAALAPLVRGELHVPAAMPVALATVAAADTGAARSAPLPAKAPEATPVAQPSVATPPTVAASAPQPAAAVASPAAAGPSGEAPAAGAAESHVLGKVVSGFGPTAPAATVDSQPAPQAKVLGSVVSGFGPNATPAATPAGAPVSAPAPASAAAPAGPTESAAAASPEAAPAVKVLGAPVSGFSPDATRVADEGVAAFAREQLLSPRVREAKSVADAPLHDAFAKVGLTFPSAHIYLRAFKREHELEVWGQGADGRYLLVKTYAICSLGGSGLGPKIRRGDEQVPEGFYHVVEFNPSSDYHLSLRLDYPNAADLARAAAPDLGNDIYLHGGCKSAGCLPLTDAGIEQIYWLAVQARAAGERDIPIDIFPARLDQARFAQLTQAFAGRKDLVAFWADLKLGYDAFERSHRLPDVSIDSSGRYRVALVAH